nr:MAG TPA: hypothetical protein [Caudoviricetes sp.]
MQQSARGKAQVASVRLVARQGRCGLRNTQ